MRLVPDWASGQGSHPYAGFQATLNRCSMFLSRLLPHPIHHLLLPTSTVVFCMLVSISLDYSTLAIPASDGR